MPFEALFFISLWVGSVSFQRFIRKYERLDRLPRIRSILTIIANPVLVTSLLGTAYLWVKASITQKDINDTLRAFRRHNTWADIVTQAISGNSSSSSSSRDPRQNVGAGDLATALLDAGIVSLGLKMFEHRRELGRSMVSLFATCLALAAGGIFADVAVARALGLPSAEAAAFAGRSATIALGAPAVANLGGSVTLTSSLVVCGGLLYQMVGDALLLWLRVESRAPDHGHQEEEPEKERQRQRQRQRQRHRVETDVTTPEVRADTMCSADNRLESDTSRGTENTENRNDGSFGSSNSCGGVDEARVIAMGITVGINAAAMGTAHLIERDSRAAAYSALSMTVSGSLTVALTAIPAVANVLMKLIS
ncbi:hypothetical protein BX600DRAFT_508680 [Xylariales sp. PMI_506]|nr:hypothetical protein BX600DRAFT_508680 [Xylariales sp. PMI_506]